jgi:predicted N-acyltransferase
MYLARIVTSLDEIDPVEWDALNAGIPFASMRWLRLGEKTQRQTDMMIVLLYKSGRLVGRGLANFSKQSSVLLATPAAQRVANAMLNRFPLLLCQTATSNSGGFVLPKGDEVEAFRVMHKALYDAARKRGASFIVLGYLSTAERDLLQRTGEYEFVSADAGTMMPIVWSYDEYLKHFPTTQRRSIRRHDADAREAGIVMETTHSWAAHKDHLAELTRNVWRKYGHTDLSVIRADIFETFEQDMPDNSIGHLARIGDKIVGCGINIHDEGLLILAFLGLDYSVRHVYFQVLHESIRYAIESGQRAVKGGTGAYHVKKRLGFQDDPTFIGYTSHRKVFKWLGRQLAQAVPSLNSSNTDAQS